MFIFDGLFDPSICGALSYILPNKNVHSIVVESYCHINSKFTEGIKSVFGCDCSVIDIEPLSSKESTQRLVHSVMVENQFVPMDGDPHAFKSLGEFTCGSPSIIETTSQILQSRFSKSDNDCHGVLCEICEEISPGTHDHSDLKLISMCRLSQEQQRLLFLRCLIMSHSSPVPVSVANELASFISMASFPDDKLVSSENLLSELLQFKLVKKYPPPIIVYPSGSFCQQEAKAGEDQLYVPQCLADSLCESLCQEDRLIIALTRNKVKFLSVLKQHDVENIIS